MKTRLEYILKHNLYIQSVYKYVFSVFFKFIGLFIRTDEKLVLLNSFGGRHYNDSPKVLFEHMICDPSFDNFKFVWAFEHPEKFDIPRAEKIKIDTWKYFKTALKAKYWITSVNIERGLNFKKKETVYLNTWHGTGPKISGNGVLGRKDYDFSYVDILCCDGEYLKNIFLKDYNALEKNILLSGRPREDELYKLTEEKIEEYRRLLDIPKGKKVIFYAPTWRESTNLGKSYSIKLPMDIEKWRSQLQDEYVILLRTHSFTNEIVGIEFDDFIRNVSDYPEINHLYAVSDVLISDYSSVFFDFAILEKPIICFAYDYEEYVRTRGLYFDLEKEFPGGVLRTEDEVIDKILNMDYLKMCKETSEFRERFVSRGDNATEMCITELLKRSKV